MRRSLRILLACCTLSCLSACTGLVDIDNTVVARVDADPIRLRDVLDRISRSPADVRIQANQQGVRQRILNDLVNEKVLLAEAEHRGIEVTEEEVAQRLQQEQNARMAQVAAGRSQEAIPTVRDPQTIRRQLKIEKLVGGHLSEENVRARYDAKRAAGADPTVQYEFISIRLHNPEFAVEIENAIRNGASPADLTRKYRGHPDVLNGGRTDPVAIRMLEPWLQAELMRHEPGQMLPPYQTEATGEPTALLIRLLAKWEFPPYDVMRQYIVQEMYEELVAKLRSEHKIATYPERLDLIDRR